MIYNVTNEFTKISETSGTIQNVGYVYPVEISDKAEADSGILLYPLNKISFADKTLYMRCAEPNGQAEIHVVPFVVDSDGNTSSGGSSTPANVATDEQIDDILDDLFPSP